MRHQNSMAHKYESGAKAGRDDEISIVKSNQAEGMM